MATTKIPQSPSPSPKKRVKLEEKPAANQEIAAARKQILDEHLLQMREIKENYVEHLTECFFLQSGQNLMDFHSWKKRPTPPLVEFLKSGKLDSDDDEENPLVYRQEKDVNKEVKVLTTGGNSVASTTPVAISSTQPMASLTSQETRKQGSRHGTVYSQVHQSQPVVTSTTVALVPLAVLPQGTVGRTACQTTTAASTTAGYIHRSVSDTKLSTLTAHSTKTIMSVSQTTAVKRTPPASPGRHKQNSGSFDGITGITTQEAIVERAKQEAQVMSRVSELRKEGLWSSRRLPKVQEPPRNKAHWDYLLEEMQWLAADFAQERKWKKAAARKLARMVQKHFQDMEQKELKAEKEEGMKLKRIAGQLAKMVREFWSNIEKVVQYKQQSRLDEKRKKALDLHLNFIVDQTEKYSSWLTEGLKTSSKGSVNTTPASSVIGDEEFKPEESESDDEETIDKDEEGVDESETKDEVAALQKESEVPLDELLESLPKEILEKPASLHSETDETDKNDDEFDAEEQEEIDVEETIEEQEKHEKKQDVGRELDDLKNEGEMDIEELRARYAGAYDSDFEMPEDSDDEEEEETEIEDSDDEQEESEEEEEEEEVDVEGEEDVGLEALVQSAEKSGAGKTEEEDEEGPGKQLTDIAAEAASLQPKGYTLQTTEVKTKVPFLLKHTLREYQHVGLDWLATMFEKRLNGILADEMGLGKTIQTIALLAHLACEKGIWGPHLIVVPTSVMLNWEMEIKKWCPAFKILTYYGNQKERKMKRMGWTKTNAFHICITSYKLVIQDHQSFRRKKWKYLILDEAQNIKNFKSQRWQTLLNFNSLRRLLLTGTPLQNSLMELWSLMHFLMPQVFQSHREFKEWFANPLTGMIEGSHEYNEKLIHRLHKVLRPFLLRRLKDDVEKQMPKKYEHVVMCPLAKRQRFLYDEFMAQGKTKETLASGHFMSVINILMQLRKVCNHPSLFDPRPIVSPFQMEGLVYHTASMVLNALKYDPLENIDIRARYPNLADMEKDLPAFIAHRVRKLQTPRHLIEEIDSQPPPTPRPPAGKLKSGTIRCVSPGISSGRASPQVSSRSVSPASFGISSSEAVHESSTVMGTSQPPLQAKVLPQSVLGSGTVTTAATTPSSQAITVQIQRTDQGTRFVVPSGFLQIVQTSTGQHLIATSSAASTVAPLATASSTVVNGEPVVTMATSSMKTSVSSVVSQVKMSPLQQTSTASTVRLPDSSAVQDSNKPVMRVSPLSETMNGHQSRDGVIFTTASTSSTTTVPVTSTSTTRSSKLTEDLRKLRKQEFFMESLYMKRRSRRKEKLENIAETNKKHCDHKPVYGQDLCDSVNIFRDPYNGKLYLKRERTRWHGPGQIHCYCAKFCQTLDKPSYLWNQTKVLSDVIHTPEQYLQELEEVLDRFVFVTPPVQCPPIQMHVSHPTPDYILEERLREHLIHTKVSPLVANYHKISTKMTVQFPELRLIQYDCGKLQTLDILLRRLKAGEHRVLIFTQMTKMLNILESFLNYHGHRYLRLDGTTRVEQRQQLMDRFNADKRIFCFILSTRSGGIGVNLTGADTVIFYDSDWNPTMDAQAQDRCHRIGQTRDVHIYRLISERTVEENILKKANQKRMLGDMAIEGGNFTTTFFKEQTISELFSEPSGLDSLVKEKEEEEREKQEKLERLEEVKKEKEEEKTEEEKIDAKAMLQFEKALAKTEDETDVISAEKAKAEQTAELAEFDENIPWDEQEAVNKDDEDSRVEKELAMLEKELSPIERFAVQFAEMQMEPVNAEELMIAEEDIANAKKDWELNRLKALKEEEERRLELEEDEMLYTYSRDDAYQQVKKRNKQLLMAQRRAAAAAKADALSPVRKSSRLSMGGIGESETEWADTSSMDSMPTLVKGRGRGRGRKMNRALVNNSSTDNTPTLITGKGRGRKRLQITPTNTPKSSPKTVGKGAKISAEKAKLNKKLKAKIKAMSEVNDNGEEIDVETVGKEEETIKQPKKSPRKKSDKPSKRALKRSPKVVLTQINTSTANILTHSSTEATLLQSLPGNSSTNPIDVDSGMPQKPEKDSVRANIFEKLSPVKPADKPKIPPSHDRGNIFEQFTQNLLQNRATGANFISSPLTSSNLRLLNTQHGRQMIVVNSGSPVQSQVPQNLVLVQGMQGLSQGLILGNNFVPLQGTPISMATLTRGTTPVAISGARLQAAPQVVTPQPTQVVSPQFSPQIAPAVQNQANQPFVQRLVSVQQSPTGNLPQIPGLSLESVQHLTGLTIPRPTTSQVITNVGQISTPQIRVQTPAVQKPVAVSSSSMQPPQSAPKLISPKKSPSHTIADLIEARNLANAAAKVERTSNVHILSGAGDQLSAGNAKLLPNLGNIMKAQVPVVSKPLGDVRVNPTVAQLVVSHINAAAAAAAAQADGIKPKISKPAIITAPSSTRSASPTIVKLVAASSLRAGSPVSKAQVVPVTTRPGPPEIGRLIATPSQPLKSNIQLGTPPTQPSKAAIQPGKTESPVATINIKGLPPGVTIPASLVNSLVSGSIGGIGKTNLNVFKGVLPAATTSGQSVNIRPQIVRPAQPVNVNVSPSPEVVGEKSATDVTKTVVTIKSGSSPLIPLPAIKTIGSPAGSPRLAATKPATEPTASNSPTLQAWSNPNLVIRTRRAAVQHPNAPSLAPTSPQPVKSSVPQVVSQPAKPSIPQVASQPIQLSAPQPVRPAAPSVVFLSDIDNEEMPLWAPPTPPHDENDVYIDKTLHFLYEPSVMPETQLPPVYVKKEKKKIKVESITTRTQKQKRQEQPRVPRSLFDRPTAQLLKLRRDAKIQKLKQGQLKLYRPMPSMPAKPIMETAPDHPEWLIHEDWALLQAVQSLFDVPLNLMIVSPAHTPNWDMVADVVNSCSRVYRSPKQCRLRYENVIIPREEGRILYDMNPRKQKKTKGLYKMTTKNNRPMKTSQIHGQDSNNAVTLLYSLRFDSVKSIATKRPPTMRQTLVNPTQKNPKHASVLQENSISYDHPLNPMQVAEIRAQRIQREKKQNQQQQQATAAQQAQGGDQTAVSSAAAVTQRTQQIATITPPQVSAATLVAVTSGVTATQLATIGSVSSTATVLTVTGVPPIQTAVRAKAPIQEISSGITASVPVATSQVRAQLQTGTTTVTTGLTQVQLAQRITAATTLASGATVQQQLTPQQYQLLRNKAVLSQQQQKQQALQQQQQLRTMQRLTLVSPDQLKQQQLRQLKGSVIQGGQKTVIAQQLVTSIPQPVKQGQLKTTPVTTLNRPLTTEELARFKQQQLTQQQQKLGQVPAGQQVAGASGSVAQIQHHAQPGQLQTTQIIAAQAPVQQVGQTLGTVSGSQAATLVKTVSTPAGSVTIPVSNVNISVSMQQKGGLAKINPQQMKQMQLLQQRKPQASIPVQKGIAGQKVGAPQMLNAVQIIQQQSGARSLTVHQLQQLMKQQPQGTIQQIIHTSQPTIIATVTQSQQQPHMVTKVVNTTLATTAAIQTITASASNSPSTTTAPVISLSQVPISSLSIASVAAAQSPVSASIVKPTGGSEGVTTVQIHPVSSLTQSKLVVPQNVVVQPIQQISGTTTGQTHVIPAQSLSQHVTLSGTPQGPVHVTVPAPSQVQHVTVATPPQTQQATNVHTQPSQVNVTVVSHPSTPAPNAGGPMTVTVTPAPVTPSPIQTPTQPTPSPVHTPTQGPVTVTYASPAQTITLTPTSMSTQPVAVTDQTVQQTVAAVLQPRQQTPSTVQQSTQQVTTQTQAQTLSGAQTQVQPSVQAQPTVPAQQSTVQSPQPTGKPAPYAMRTRKQSERQ